MTTKNKVYELLLLIIVLENVFSSLFGLKYMQGKSGVDIWISVDKQILHISFGLVNYFWSGKARLFTILNVL